MASCYLEVRGPDSRVCSLQHSESVNENCGHMLAMLNSVKWGGIRNSCSFPAYRPLMAGPSGGSAFLLQTIGTAVQMLRTSNSPLSRSGVIVMCLKLCTCTEVCGTEALLSHNVGLG